MTSDLLIAKSNKPFSDLILFDHTIAFHAVYLSRSWSTHEAGSAIQNACLPPLLPSPSLHASLREAHLLHTPDPHFAETQVTISQCFRYCFLTQSFKSYFSTLFSPIPFLLVPLSGRVSMPQIQCISIYILPTIGKAYYISKPYQKFILNRTQISPKSSLTISLSSSSSLFHGSGFLPRFLLL